jgi:phage terminase large subunit-like protein
MSLSPAERFAHLPADDRKAWLASLSDAERAALRYQWRTFWARPEQLPPPEPWRVWLAQTARGWGKTRAGAETVRAWVESGKATHIALVNDTAADVRDVQVEGLDGLLAICPPWNRPLYEPSKRRLTWPSGAVAICYAAESPGLLRGPQHDGGWCDELAKWKNLRRTDEHGETAWSNLQMGLRVGDHPQCVITTTPRPIPLIKALQKQPGVVVTHGRLEDNRANVSEEWYESIHAQYAGTRLGRQELGGELIENVEGALWTLDVFDAHRVQERPKDLKRVVVAIDPPGSVHGAEAGIVAVGLGTDGHGYVLADMSEHYTPEQWGRVAVQLYDAEHADALVAETNYGGQMVGSVVRSAAQALQQGGLRSSSIVNVKIVTASRGKQVRAEPISALYAQGRMHHVGTWATLEDQCATWVPGNESPDRMDALVWAVTDLLITQRGSMTVVKLAGF